MPTHTEIREEYRPSIIRGLFIGESPPAQGTFFYNENSNLYKYTKRAFEQVTNNPFNCEQFKKYGCWLYDVCDIPVNGLPNAERRDIIRMGIPRLVEALHTISPEYVYIVKKGIFFDIVHPCILRAGYKDGINSYSLPFPACGQQLNYINELSYCLRNTIFNG